MQLETLANFPQVEPIRTDIQHDPNNKMTLTL